MPLCGKVNPLTDEKCNRQPDHDGAHMHIGPSGTRAWSLHGSTPDGWTYAPVELANPPSEEA